MAGEPVNVFENVAGLLELLPAEPGDWAACDADGTLWAADVAEIVWSAAIRERWFLPESHAVLAHSVESAGLISGGDPHEDAETLWALYLQDRVDDWVLLKAMTACYAGYAPDDLAERAEAVLHAELPGRTYVTTDTLFAGLADRGLQTVVISGSPKILVEAALRAVGISNPPPALGVELAVEAGRLTAEVLEPITWEQGKVDAWKRLAGDGARLSAAFGDSPGDTALLSAAQHARVLVQPRPALREIAEAGGHPWCELRPGSTRNGTPVVPPRSNRVIDL